MPTPPIHTVRRLAVLAAVALLAACSSDGGSTGSNTPQITVSDTAGVAATDVLLTQDELHDVPGFEQGTIQPFNSVPAFTNPDPRGPCGGKASNPPLDGAAGTAYSAGNTAVAFHLVTPTTDLQRSYLIALSKDRKDPCPTWQSTTNTGSTQTVSDTSFVDVSDVAADALSWTATVGSGTAKAYAGVLILVDDQITSLVQMQSLSPISAETMHAFAQQISG
jgi:hypothetical protein